MEPPPEAKLVGRGLDAPTMSPQDPQAWLHESNHPYSPFTGNALKWDSYMYDDGTTYEGLTREDAPNMKGVLILGSGLGGGLQRAQKGDKYEGEFHMGFIQGLGQYTGMNGEVYRGEWVYGKRHGCGALIDQGPFLKKVEKGMNPDKAWEQSREEVERKTRYGTWQSDAFLDGPDSTGQLCHMDEIRGVLQELDSVVTRARMFRFKPDGEYSFTKSQDAVGLPAPLMQDPIHYPHGTKFMAPGPMGQCFPLPDDPYVRENMRVNARNHQRIYDMYNFDVVPRPGSDMEKATKLWEKQEAEKTTALKKRAEAEKRRHQRTAQRTRQRQQRSGDHVDQPSKPDDEADSGQAPNAFGSITLSFGQALQGASSRLNTLAAQSVRQFRPLFSPPRQ